MRDLVVVLVGTSLSIAARASADPPQDDLTILAAAPKGINDSHLGRPYSATFEPLIGKEGKTLFPGAKKAREDVRNEFNYDVVEIDNSHQFRANASGWGVSTDVSAAAEQRYTAYRAYQVTKVQEIDDTTDPRAVSAKGAYYVRRIYYGRMLEVVVTGNSSLFTVDAKAEFLVLGGSIAAFAKKYQLDYKIVGRGLKATNPTEALFAKTQDAIKEADVADPDFNGGNVVPILVEYRRIPSGSLPDFEEYEWKKEEAGVAAKRLRLRSVDINSRDDDWQTSGFTLNKGDRAIIFASGAIDINGKWLIRNPDSREQHPDGNKWTRPAAGVLQLKLGELTELTGAKTVVESTEDGKELKFRVADSNYKDNSGHYTVRVLLVPADAAPDEPEQ